MREIKTGRKDIQVSAGNNLTPKQPIRVVFVDKFESSYGKALSVEEATHLARALLDAAGQALLDDHVRINCADNHGTIVGKVQGNFSF